MTYAEIGERAMLPERHAPSSAAQEPGSQSDGGSPAGPGSGLRLVAYKPLFSGAAVERTPELAFQRADGVVELARRTPARAAYGTARP